MDEARACPLQDRVRWRSGMRVLRASESLSGNQVAAVVLRAGEGGRCERGREREREGSRAAGHTERSPATRKRAAQDPPAPAQTAPIGCARGRWPRAPWILGPGGDRARDERTGGRERESCAVPQVPRTSSSAPSFVDPRLHTLTARGGPRAKNWREAHRHNGPLRLGSRGTARTGGLGARAVAKRKEKLGAPRACRRRSLK